MSASDWIAASDVWIAGRRPRVYLAGPMRGRPRYNFPAFLEVGFLLRSLGFQVHNPAEYDLECGIRPTEPLDSPHNKANFSLEKAFLEDLTQIIGREGIVLLPGWTMSKGASLEYLVARWTGKRVWEVVSYQPAAPETLKLERVPKDAKFHLFPDGVSA